MLSVQLFLVILISVLLWPSHYCKMLIMQFQLLLILYIFTKGMLHFNCLWLLCLLESFKRLCQWCPIGRCYNTHEHILVLSNHLKINRLKLNQYPLKNIMSSLTHLYGINLLAMLLSLIKITSIYTNRIEPFTLQLSSISK